MFATIFYQRILSAVRTSRLAIALVLTCLALSGQRAQADSFDFDDSFRDMQHTMMARETLLRDQNLGSLNLGVKVENRVALMWGTVPNKALRQQAIQMVENLPGILRVRSQLFVNDEDFDWPALTPPNTTVVPDTPFLAKASSPWVSSKPKAFPQTPPAFAPKQAEQPKNTWLTQQSTQQEPEKTTWKTAKTENPIQPAVVEPPRDEESGLFVLPVVMAVGPQPKPGLSIAQRIPVSPLREKLNRLRDSQVRFRNISIQILDAKVYLGGEVPRLQDVHQFARAVSYLPEVDAVIIGQVQAKSIGP